MKAYHFTNGNYLRDGRNLPAIGEKLVHTEKLVICKSGLHASLQPFNALHYAPGSTLHLVECEGKMLHQDDKLVCTERTILASIDATELLYYFARMQALKVVHLWNDAPQIVLDYLMTGDASLRIAARDASYAISDASFSATFAAADAAARATYVAAREAAARAAAHDAARAAYVAAREAAAYAAADVAADAAYVAAREAADVAYVAAREAAARAAAREAARKEFNELVYETFGV